MKKLLLILSLFLIALYMRGAVSFDQIPNNYGKRNSVIVFNDELINATATVESDPFTMGPYNKFGIWVKATSVSGTPAVTIAIEYSPTNEDANFSQLEGGSIQWTSLADELPHNDIMINKPSNFGRVVVSGGATNPADTLITIVVNKAY